MGYRQNILNTEKHITSQNVRFLNFKNLKEPDSIVVVGMGGSGHIGDILECVRADIDLKKPIVVIKDEKINLAATDKPLFVFISFSGNTLEAINAFKNIPAKFQKLVITSGGELEMLAKAEKCPLALFEPDGLVPRQAKVLMSMILFKSLKSFVNSIKIPKIDCCVRRLEPVGRNLAHSIYSGVGIDKKLILIYTLDIKKVWGYDFKIKLNETAKHQAFNNILPEAFHNEVVGLEAADINNLFILFLGDKGDDYFKKLVNIYKLFLNTLKVQNKAVFIDGKNNLERTFNALILADLTSYYLALKSCVDPARTISIERIKNIRRINK